MVLAGGMENMTQAPFLVIRGLRNGLRLGGGTLEDSLMAGLTDYYCSLPSDDCGKACQQYGVTRKEADLYALRSQQAADAAYKNAGLRKSIPVEVSRRRPSS